MGSRLTTGRAVKPQAPLGGVRLLIAAALVVRANVFDVVRSAKHRGSWLSVALAHGAVALAFCRVAATVQQVSTIWVALVAVVAQLFSEF
jgi:hypothetical protein